MAFVLMIITWWLWHEATADVAVITIIEINGAGFQVFQHVLSVPFPHANTVDRTEDPDL